MLRIGLISDTHGTLRPQALAALQGSDFIVHAGDIGDPAIIERLRGIAPVTAVRGNNDIERWAFAYPDRAVLEAGALRLYVLHNISELEFDPAAKRFDIVVSGHSHRPHSRQRGRVLFVNPGSAGPRRFRLPVSVGTLSVDDGRISVQLHELEC